MADARLRRLGYEGKDRACKLSGGSSAHRPQQPCTAHMEPSTILHNQNPVYRNATSGLDLTSGAWGLQIALDDALALHTALP